MIEGVAMITESEQVEKGFMKAIVRDRYGSPDVLQLKEVAKPAPNDVRGVLVKIYASSVNPADRYDVRGPPFLIRLVQRRLRRVRNRPRKQNSPETNESLLRGIRRRPYSRTHRITSSPQPRTHQTRTEGTGQWCGWWSRNICGPDCQVIRNRSHRCDQHEESRHGPIPRRRPRHRLCRGRLHEEWRTLRSDL